MASPQLCLHNSAGGSQTEPFCLHLRYNPINVVHKPLACYNMQHTVTYLIYSFYTNIALIHKWVCEAGSQTNPGSHLTPWTPTASYIIDLKLNKTINIIKVTKKSLQSQWITG